MSTGLCARAQSLRPQKLHGTCCTSPSVSALHCTCTPSVLTVCADGNQTVQAQTVQTVHAQTVQTVHIQTERAHGVCPCGSLIWCCRSPCSCTLADDVRTIKALTPAPRGTLLAATDNLGRVLLLDAAVQVSLRTFAPACACLRTPHALVHVPHPRTCARAQPSPVLLQSSHLVMH